MSTVAYVVGTRPNFVKMAPVVSQMKTRLPSARHALIHTEQHYDPELSAIFFDELGLDPPDFELGVGSGTHGEQTARGLERIEAALVELRPDVVVVAGDVNSTLAGALAAAKLEIPVAHVEAGLRSFDRSMPEEINRILVDQLSAWCFTHSPEAVENLRREGIADDRIHAVGNTMIDTLVRLLPRIEASTIVDQLGLTPGSYVVATLHRPAMVETDLLIDALDALSRLGRELPVVLPLHPRTAARLDGREYDGVILAPPLGYLDFVALEMRAAAVVTDSGGVQEEATFLRVPCFTLRNGTERPVTVDQGTNTVLGLSPSRIDSIAALRGSVRLDAPLPDGWDGQAALRVAGVLGAALEAGEPTTEGVHEAAIGRP